MKPSLDLFDTAPKSMGLAASKLASIVSGRIQRQIHTQGFELPILCLATITVSFFLMFMNIGTKPFWVDEAIAVLPARSILTEGVPRSPFDLNFMAPQLEDGIWDPSAPLYRYSVAAVAAIFGFSETSTRGWSVFLALLLLLPCYRLFQRLYGDTTALLAVAFLAASTHFADFAREARHFTFVACMMAFTFYFLFEATTKDSERSRALWPVFLLATVLGHVAGYLALPIVFVFLLFAWRRPLFSRRLFPLYVILTVVYIAILAKYGNTLPFLHPVGCYNHPAGCHPEPTFYVWVLLAFLTGAGFDSVPFSPVMSLQVSLANVLIPGTLLVAGLTATLVSIRSDRERRPGHLLVLAWFLLPLCVLSTREVKFPRYLVYILPPMSLFLASGLVAFTKRRWLSRARRPLRALLAAVVVLAPQLREEPVDGGRKLLMESRFVTHALETSFDEDTDNWQRTRAKVAYLKEHMQPGDIVVTSLDDASLGYYLGRFVYGFLNSQHDDAFFLGLLSQASRQDGRLWFVDTLPTHNYCHTGSFWPLSIDCRKKYRRFYEACLAGSLTFDPTCTRLEFH